MADDKLVGCTVEIAKAVVANAGEKAVYVLGKPGEITALMDAVHSKLVELDKAQR